MYRISIKRNNVKRVSEEPYKVVSLPSKWEKWEDVSEPGEYAYELTRMLEKCEIRAYKGGLTMKDFLYLQYLVIRPMGVAPDDKDFDRKAEFALHNIMDDERQANILADEKVCLDCFGRMMSFVVRVPFTSDGWYPPQHMSIKGNRIYQGGMSGGDWYDQELSTNINNIYCLEG